MKKILLGAGAIAVIVGGGAFYGGMKYAQGGNRGGNFANVTPEQRQQFAANAGAGLRGGPGGQGRAGTDGAFTVGEIISKDDKSITVKMQDGGSRIVFYSGTTGISRFSEGTGEDLVVGKSVSINGTTNQDGSLTAQSIQLRPAPAETPSN